MKKIYFSALALVFGASFTLNAQILNPSFEDWTAGEPDSWLTLNSITTIGDVTVGADPVVPVVEVATGATDGNKYAKATSFSLANSTNSGAPDGDYGSFLNQEFNSTNKFASFSIDINYDIKPGDQGIVVIQAISATNALVGNGSKTVTGSQANLATVLIEMTYTGIPAKYVMYIASSEKEIFAASTKTIKPGSWIGADKFTVGAIVNDAPNVTNVVATDISNNGNGTDLKVTFNVPASEANIENYYLVVMATTVSVSNFVTPGPYFVNAGVELTPNGSAQTHIFDAADLYVKFNAGQTGFEFPEITEGVAFKVHVYVAGKPGFAGVFNASNAITLTSSPASVVDYSKLVNVYPNPATDFVNFQIDGLENGTVTINSITGQEVVNTTFNSGTKQIDVNHLNNGVYIYAVRNANGEIVKTNKLVIRK